MKRAFTSAILLTAAAALVLAQGGPKKFTRTTDNALVKPQEISVQINGKTINISYSAPSMRGRKIFTPGGLLANTTVWRAGADDATCMHTDAPLDMNGLTVPAGDYSLWVDLTGGKWQFIINKETGQWGTNYDKSKDFGKVAMTMGKSPAPVEQYKMTLTATGGNKGKLELAWENTTASVNFTVKSAPVAEPGTFPCTECSRPFSPDDLARFGVVLICPNCKERYVQKLREGVPSAAAVEYGGFWIRFVAWMIDGIILMVIGSVLQFALVGSMALKQPQPGSSPEVLLGAMAGMVGVVFVLDMVIGCSYEAFFVSSSLSATPGKLAVELKVVRPNGARLTLGRGVGRYFAKRLNMMTAGVGYVLAGFDSEKRALHDLICDTRVVRRTG